VALVLLGLLTIVFASVLAEVAAQVDTSFAQPLVQFPSFFDPLWLILVLAPVGWVLIIVVAALVRRRLALVRDMVAGVVLAMLLAILLGALVADEPWASVSHLADLDGPPVFPPGVITATAAALGVASPHLVRPSRHLGRWLLLGQFLGTLFLGMTLGSGGVVALMSGLAAASTIHLVVGSPGGRPTPSRIMVALRDLGLDVDQLAPAQMQAEGVVRFTGRDAAGPLDVKVYGRDAWDAQMLANLWRLAWYRDPRRTARLSRLELVEHEGFVALLAERAGLRTPRLVTAGNAGQGDALVVVRPDGMPLVLARPDVSDAALGDLWADLMRLHGAGVVHGAIDLDRVLVRDDGSLGFGDLASATVGETVGARRRDEAQMLALAVLLAGEERAVASTRASLGDEEVLAMVPYLQEAALSGPMRAALDEVGIELDDVRNRTSVALGAGEQPLIKLRRVSAGSLLNLALLALAAYTLIGLFGGLDLATFVDELRDASWSWLLLALLLAQVPRVPAAVSTMGSIARPLPLGPLTALQFAICYVNLAIPSTAARVAINVRFFQRFGVRPAEAMTAGVIDSVSGFTVQILLFVCLFGLSDVDLGFSLDTGELSGAATLALIALGVVLVAGLVVVLVRPVRRRVVAVLQAARSALGVLRSPTKLLQLFGGNVVSQVLFAVALAACAEAFGVHVPLSELLLINTVVSLFAGLLPIPGGIGVSEAGLTYGLIAAGVSSEKAFAVAIAYRFASFYLPPIWGWMCYRWLIQRRYL